MSEANQTQIGGDHYKTGGLEHWDLIENHGIGYLEGCATKYVTRCRKKNGLQDLDKATHYVIKLRELAMQNKRYPTGAATVADLQAFFRSSRCNELECAIIGILCTWSVPEDLTNALNLLSDYRRLLIINGPRTLEDGGHHARQTENPA